jgi:uncharacterized protein YegL
MSELRNFTVNTARPLPVIILADVSGSMGGEGKIGALNQAMRDMLATFADVDNLLAEIHVSVITFGGGARVHMPLQPASHAEWTDMTADGGTPMGAAIQLAAELIEDRQQIPGRAYRPIVILASDGQPTDTWKPSVRRLTEEGRAAKADRLALAIGGDADEAMLSEFLNNPEKQVYYAEDAMRIKDFFRFVTMSISARSRSANPNVAPQIDDPFGLKDY